ncbi:MAG TPA: AAA family ATPase [Gemmatimonadales bacterium]|nr:AAA family ATPase [Gemmatimonadales bacterium]
MIPIQCEYYGLEGISQLLNTVRLVQQNINPGLAIGGVLLTMYDSRLNLCRQVAEDATEYFGPKVFGTPIPRNVRLAEAPSFGKPILLYDVQSVGAKSYLAVAQELLRRVEGTEVTIAAAQVAAATAQAAATATSSERTAGAQDSPAPVPTDTSSLEESVQPPLPVEAEAPPESTTAQQPVAEQAAVERPDADMALLEQQEAHERAEVEPGPEEYAPLDPVAPAGPSGAGEEETPAMEAAAELPATAAKSAEDGHRASPAELDRLAADGGQQPSSDGEPVAAAAPMNGTEAVAGETADEEATRISHQSEPKPEVTT